MAFVDAVLDFTAESAVVAAGIDLLIFHECAFGDQVFKLLVGQEVITDAVDFAGAWFAVCGRHGKLQVEFSPIHDVANYG